MTSPIHSIFSNMILPLSPVLGGALCVLMIQFLRVPSLKLSTFLLLALLVYDVFWVSETENQDMDMCIQCMYMYMM